MRRVALWLMFLVSLACAVWLVARGDWPVVLGILLYIGLKEAWSFWREKRGRHSQPPAL